MGYLVAISCARAEREHAEILKAFLEEELGETVVDPAGGAPQPTVFFYIDDRDAGVINQPDPKNPGQPRLADRIEELYDDCEVMAAIIGAGYANNSIVARECHILTNRAKKHPGDVLMLLPGCAIPKGADIHLESKPQEALPLDPLNSDGFSRLRAIARKIVNYLDGQRKKPVHPRMVRGANNGGRLPIQRHLGGLHYVLAGQSQEASEGVQSSAVLLGRLEQTRRAALVATAIVDLAAIAAVDSQATAPNPSNLDAASFVELQEHAILALFELASRQERDILRQELKLGLRVKLLLRFENYVFRRTAESQQGRVKPLRLGTFTSTLQDIVLPDPKRNPSTLTRQACAVLHHDGARVAEELANCQWRCEIELCEVADPRRLDELTQFREYLERHITTQPRPL